MEKYHTPVAPLFFTHPHENEKYIYIGSHVFPTHKLKCVCVYIYAGTEPASVFAMTCVLEERMGEMGVGVETAPGLRFACGLL